MKSKSRGVAVAFVGAALFVPSAQATEGSLYPVEAGQASVSAPWAAAATAELGVWQVSVPAGAVTEGTKFSVPFSCPVAGTQLETVQYERLRAAAPSSFGADVIANGARVFRDPDVNWPQTDGTRRRVSLPGGACDVRLDLVQSESRQQHKRTWFIGGVVAFARDIAPPEVSITSLPSVVGPGAEAVSLRYTVTDNMGDDGVGDHQIEVDDKVVATRSGTGDFTVRIPIENLPERDHTVRIVANGDGTIAGLASRQFGIDRTGPEVLVTTKRLADRRVRVTVRGADDLRDWEVRVSTYVSAQQVQGDALIAAASELPVVANGNGPGSAIVDLDNVRRGELVRLVVYARDAAGNLKAQRAQWVYTGAPQKIVMTRNSRTLVGKAQEKRTGLASRIETTIGARVALAGRVRLLPSGRPLPLTSLQVRDPSGRRVSAVRTKERGVYRVAFRPKVSGTYRFLLEGEGRPVAKLKVFVRPRLGVRSMSSSSRKISKTNRVLVVPGTLKAGNRSADARVDLQQKVGKSWRTIASDFTNGSGQFKIRHRPTRKKDAKLTMRVRVAGDPGRAYSAKSTKPFTVQVAKG